MAALAQFSHVPLECGYIHFVIILYCMYAKLSRKKGCLKKAALFFGVGMIDRKTSGRFPVNLLDKPQLYKPSGGGKRMGRTRKRKAVFEHFETRKPTTPYLRITKDMMESAAWQELDPFDVTVYLYMKSKFTKNNAKGTDKRDDISLTYEEISGKMSQNRFKKSIDNLIEKGFINLVLHRPQNRQATIYGLSARWHYYGTKDFKEQKRPVISRSPTLEEPGEEKNTMSPGDMERCHQETWRGTK